MNYGLSNITILSEVGMLCWWKHHNLFIFSDSAILAPRDNGTILQPTRNDSTKTLLGKMTEIETP